MKRQASGVVLGQTNVPAALHTLKPSLECHMPRCYTRCGGSRKACIAAFCFSLTSYARMYVTRQHPFMHLLILLWKMPRGKGTMRHTGRVRPAWCRARQEACYDLRRCMHYGCSYARLNVLLGEALYQTTTPSRL